MAWPKAEPEGTAPMLRVSRRMPRPRIITSQSTLRARYRNGTRKHTIGSEDRDWKQYRKGRMRGAGNAKPPREARSSIVG